MSELGLIALPILLLILRQNLILILFAMAAYIHFFYGDGVLEYIIEDMWIGLDKEVLLSVPLFILCGNVMTKGQIAFRLINIMKELTAGLPGGLAIATILSCAVFAAISGSSAVTLLSVGAILYPALCEAGYSRKFALGALTSGGTLGVVIPPSIPMILFGIVTETSITDLFKAGILPGIIMTILMSIYALRVNWALPKAGFSFRKLGASVQSGFWSLMMPVILLGGIYSGYFTPTESAAVAFCYAIVVEVAVHREMTLKDLYGISIETAKLLGALFPLLAIAMSLNLLLTTEQVPQNLTSWVASFVESDIAFLLAINILLLLIGCFLDINAGILILAPILLPLALNFGIDPVHLGIIMVINLEVGFLTPPVGINLLVAMSAFKEKLGLICRSVLPFMGIILVVLLIVTFLPEVALISNQ
ncbi:TRAP transporter large permease [Sneathiella limimaris]|uniref:TRAP transporter large permease n=1 Tax=Sneathiella limimaris TaxID=1964213 RepID=UPI00146BE69E|nr:TRAP transporter large permease subunit [Sneathiella limimaris]